MKLPWVKWKYTLSPTKEGLGKIKRHLTFVWIGVRRPYWMISKKERRRRAESFSQYMRKVKG
jgi:hypothetical protein